MADLNLLHNHSAEKGCRDSATISMLDHFETGLTAEQENTRVKTSVDRDGLNSATSELLEKSSLAPKEEETIHQDKNASNLLSDDLE